MTGPTDAELMARVCGGDHDAFALIVERYKDSLVNYLSHMTGNRDRAEEHAQAAFVRLFVGSSGAYDIVVGLKQRSRPAEAPRPVSLQIPADGIY